MWHQLVSSLAIISGCILAAEPARAAMPVADNGDNDAELFHETDSNALIAGEGPTFARTDATTGGAGDDAMFATAKVVDGEELDEARGGFVLDGLDIRLGAEVQTLVNGELAMTSAIRWTDAGVQTTQYVSDALSAPTAAQLQAGLLKTGNISLNVGDSTVLLANNGQTALIQSVEGGFRNVVVNTANNTDIQMLVNATVDLSGYSAFQANQQTNTLNTFLNMAIDNATIGIVSH